MSNLGCGKVVMIDWDKARRDKEELDSLAELQVGNPVKLMLLGPSMTFPGARRHCILRLAVPTQS